MRKVNVTKLYRQLSRELKDLPFAVVKDGEVVAVCSEYTPERPAGAIEPPDEQRPDQGVFMAC
uniref:Uncharacterized protein n=1 Tax=viral metagenome TaxID=1070528 RepID=A0A6M3IQE8_9ZZZZ